jgi:hypothetical protein
MPAAGKFRGHPGPHYFRCQPRADYPCPQTENICIIVLPAHLGGKHLIAEGCPDSVYTICSHGHADACPANKDTALASPFLYQSTHRSGKIRIVNGISRVAPLVVNCVPLFFSSRSHHDHNQWLPSRCHLNNKTGVILQISS